MKKIILGLMFLGSVSALTSCNSTSVNPDDIALEETTIVEMSLAVTHGDSTRGDRGRKHNITKIEVSALPATITSYISSTYAGSTIKHAGKLEDGSFVVHVTKADGTSVGVKFSAAGAFVSEKAQKARPASLDLATLPAGITSYVTANYAGGSIQKAFKKEDGSFVVIVKKSDETRVGLAFSAAGAFTSEITVKGKGDKGGKGGKGRG
jgi:hypothetical protein